MPLSGGRHDAAATQPNTRRAAIVHEEAYPPCPSVHEMPAQEPSGLEVVYSDEVVAASLWRRHDVVVDQDDWYLLPVENGDYLSVDRLDVVEERRRLQYDA